MTIQSLKKKFANFYVLFAMFFTIWMIFFDGNDFISQYRLSQKLRSLKAEKSYYAEKIESISEEREALLSDDALMEKFAREKYLMKKKSEDLYVIVQE